MEETEGDISFVAKFSRNTMVWRNIITIMQGKTNFYEFELNPIFYEMPRSIQTCFMQGFADASSMPSETDRYFKRNRIVLQIPQNNWKLPVQICRLLQVHLKIPVSHIIYGHPSLGRDFREHRMRIFPEDFIKVGYGFSFKQDILKAFIEPKKNIRQDSSNFCNPKAKRIPKKKEKYPKEKDEKLPENVRKHFNSYWQICKACGCKQGKKKS